MHINYIPIWSPRKGWRLVSYKIVGFRELVSSGKLPAKATEYILVLPHPLIPTRDIFTNSPSKVFFLFYNFKFQ